jgi:hypothetical protein
MHCQPNIKRDKFGSQCFKCKGIAAYCVGKRLVFETFYSEKKETYGLISSNILLAPFRYAQIEGTAQLIMNVTWAYIFGTDDDLMTEITKNDVPGVNLHRYV